MFWSRSTQCGVWRPRFLAATCASAAVGAAGLALWVSGLAPAAARPSNLAPSSASQGLDVLPFPGTPDASPGTNVIFPAVSPSEIAKVTVVGSRSGVHAGRLTAQPDHQGTAFSPARPFSPGERVSVTASLSSAAAGTASGAPRARRLRFSFSVARPISVAATTESGAMVGGMRGSAGGTAATSSHTHSFVTQPSFHVPWITTSGHDTDTSSGRIFLNTQVSRQNAVYFVNGKGQIQWYHPTPGMQARMTRVQTYNGHRVITFWQGRYICPPCGGQGEGVIMNRSYKTIHTVKAGDGYQQQGADLHEFALGHQGSKSTAFIQIWSPVQANLTSVGGPPNGIVYDWIIQEIDVATGKVIWEWHALGHVPISASYQKYIPNQPYDYFHMNSIQQLPDGRILVSGHSTWAVYSIEKKTGKIAWELGGKHSTFSMGPHTKFYWQHDATLHGHGLLTVFDDGAYYTKVENQSRALLIHLGNNHASLVHAYTHNPPLLATAAGSVQILPNHNVFVGWGTAHAFSEYKPGPSHSQIFSDGFDHPIESYRAYRLPWMGHPLWSPAVAVRRTPSANHYNVYVSWNGATQVARWRVRAGPSSHGPFKALKKVAWASFETKIPVSTNDSYFEVQALSKKGKVLFHGTSAAVQAGP